MTMLQIYLYFYYLYHTVCLSLSLFAFLSLFLSSSPTLTLPTISPLTPCTPSYHTLSHTTLYLVTFQVNLELLGDKYVKAVTESMMPTGVITEEYLDGLDRLRIRLGKYVRTDRFYLIVIILEAMNWLGN